MGLISKEAKQTKSVRLPLFPIEIHTKVKLYQLSKVQKGEPEVTFEQACYELLSKATREIGGVV